MAYGEKISALRKSKGMTQAAMGAKLNVTYQAVSKWERDESDPDFATMSRIAKLFGVPLTYFEDDEDVDAGESGEPAEPLPEGTDAALPPSEGTAAPQGESVPPQPEAEPAETAVAPAPPATLGVCTVCGKTVTTKNVSITVPRLVCKDCVERKKRAQEQLKQKKLDEIKRKKEHIRGMAEYRRRKGLTVAAVVTAIVAVGLIIGMVLNKGEDLAYALPSSIFLLLCTFAFTSQMFWNDAIYKLAHTGGPLIGTPGVIFTLDLSGVIFLVGVKILFAVLRFLVYLVVTVFCWIAAFVASPFLFVPQLLKLNQRVHLA